MRVRREIPWRVRWSVGFSPAHRYGIAVLALMALPPLSMTIAAEAGAGDVVILGVSAVAMALPASWMIGLWGGRE